MTALNCSFIHLDSYSKCEYRDAITNDRVADVVMIHGGGRTTVFHYRSKAEGGTVMGKKGYTMVKLAAVTLKLQLQLRGYDSVNVMPPG